MKKIYPISIALLLAALALLDGYRTGTRLVGEVPLPLGAAQTIEQAPVQSQPEAQTRSSVERALDAAPLSSYEARLANALGTDLNGQKLRRLLTADSHTAQVPEASTLARQYIGELQSDPVAGLAVLELGLTRIPSYGFGIERATLLLTAGLLKHQEVHTRELALWELNHPAGSGDFAAPISAHSVFLRVSSDADQALAGTIQGIVAQPNESVRGTLAQQFINQFGTHRQRLLAALDERGIQLAYLKTEAPR